MVKPYKHIAIETGKPGWSIYECDSEIVFPGADAVISLDEDDGQEWGVSLFVDHDDDDGQNTAMFLCRESLASMLWQVMDSYQGSEHPDEAGALLISGEGGEGLESLKNIMEKALAYINAIQSEGSN